MYLFQKLLLQNNEFQYALLPKIQFYTQIINYQQFKIFSLTKSKFNVTKEMGFYLVFQEEPF